MGTPNDPHEIHREGIPAEETGLQIPQEQPVRIVPEHNEEIYKIPNNDRDPLPGEEPTKKPPLN